MSIPDLKLNKIEPLAMVFSPYLTNKGSGKDKTELVRDCTGGFLER